MINKLLRKKLFLFGFCLAASTGLILLFGYRWVKSRYRCQDCNVILISIDTLRADHLNCYGYAADTSSHIAEFSKDTALFQQAIAQAPSTAPSHASMLTGVIPSVHNTLVSKKSKMSDSIRPLAEILKSKGFSTASFNGGAQVSAQFGFDRGFDIYQSFSRTDYENERFRDRISEGINWIETHKDQKFFLFLHSFEVHVPYAPDAQQLAALGSSYRGPVPNVVTETYVRSINKKRVILDDEDRRHIVDLYDSEIRGMDEAFAELDRYLRSSGLFDKTIIIFTSDHGEEFSEHGKMATHADTLFDEVLKVPLLIKFPHQMFAGKQVQQQVRSIDILPTVLDVLHIEPDPQVQGRSLIGLLQGDADFDPYAISQIDAPAKRLPRSLRSLGWKYLADRHRLFNLAADPQERNNVAVEFPEVLARMQAEVKRILRVKKADQEKSLPIDEKTMEQLRSLGYVK